jgi:hypothetical protein
VRGRIENLFGVCPEAWFSVNDQLIHANADTDYKKKDDSCRDLREGKQVTVRGTVQTALGRQYVLAESIEIKK